MLYIKMGPWAGYEWHIGEEIPEDMGRVVNFQAYGDELNLFRDAMAASRGDDPKVQWTKFRRFESFGGQSASDPVGLVAAILTFPNGRTVRLTQKAVDRLMQPDPTVVYGELARPSNE